MSRPAPEGSLPRCLLAQTGLGGGTVVAPLGRFHASTRGRRAAAYTTGWRPFAPCRRCAGSSSGRLAPERVQSPSWGGLRKRGMWSAPQSRIAARRLWARQRSVISCARWRRERANGCTWWNSSASREPQRRPSRLTNVHRPRSRSATERLIEQLREIAFGDRVPQKRPCLSELHVRLRTRREPDLVAVRAERLRVSERRRLERRARGRPGGHALPRRPLGRPRGSAYPGRSSGATGFAAPPTLAVLTRSVTMGL